MRIIVIGPGRAGTAIHQHACAAGFESRLTCEPCGAATADVVVLAVPDPSQAQVAAAVPVGPLICSLSGAVPLDALPPGAAVLHPMQTIQPGRDDLQLSGCTAGITAADPDTVARVADLATALGMRPIEIPEAMRPVPHIACVLASNLLLPGLVGAMRALEASGLDHRRTEILGPLAHRAIDNALAAGPEARATGPVARGDDAGVRAHRERLRTVDPQLDRTYALLSTALLPLVDDASAAAVASALGLES